MLFIEALQAAYEAFEQDERKNMFEDEGDEESDEDEEHGSDLEVEEDDKPLIVERPKIAIVDEKEDPDAGEAEIVITEEANKGHNLFPRFPKSHS